MTVTPPPAVDDWHAAAWMQTYTGRAFRPWAAEVADIDPADIARSLSMQCRYNGHVKRFYSVAEHSHHIAEYFVRNGRRDLALWGLLHDAAEAYIGDMVRPLKITAVMDAYRDLDKQLTALVALRFGAVGLEVPAEVHAADNRILLDERAVLLGEPAEPWHQDTQQVMPLDIDVHCYSPGAAERLWLAGLEDLTS